VLVGDRAASLMDTSPCSALRRSSPAVRSSCPEDSPGSGIPKALRGFPSLRSLSFLRSISMKPSHPMRASIAHSPVCVEGFSDVLMQTHA
jgi:hypothetical protein